MHLPTSGTLKQLYLKGNNIHEYTPLALYSAMSRCQSTKTNDTNAAASFNMTLEAPGCELDLNVGAGQEPPDLVYCIVPQCNSTLQAVPFEACDKGNIASEEKYALKSRCDSIVDCSKGEDEMDCQGTMELEEVESETRFGACDFVTAYFKPIYTIRYGVANIPMTEAGRITINVDDFAFPLDESQPAIAFSKSNIFNSLFIKAAFAEARLVVSANYSLPSAPDTNLMCTVSYLVTPTQNSPTSTPISATTPQSPTAAAAEGLDGTGTLAAVVGGAAGALVLIVSLGYMFLHRRRRAELYKHRLDSLAPLIPESLKAQVFLSSAS